MEEMNWYAKLRSQMEETLWYMKQQFRSLQDYRKSIQKRWNDEAARYLNAHNLDPHAEDIGEMLRSLEQQQTKLKQTDACLESANNSAIAANQLSEEIVKLLEFAQQELERSYTDYHVYQDNHAAAKSLLSTIEDLIKKAEVECPKTLKLSEYTEARECDRGWYKAMVDTSRNPHILLSEKKEYIEKQGRSWHDHYYKKGDKWYIQVTVSEDHPLAKGKGHHAYNPNKEYEEDLQSDLDKLWEQLTKDISWEN